MKSQVVLFVVALAATALSLPLFSGAGAVADPIGWSIERPTEQPVDLAAGEQVYSRCIGCHSPERNRTGPRHCGLLGRVSGTEPGYEYSAAMQAANILWSTETLNLFLQSPLTEVPGTSMGFAGIADPVERRNLIAWLATLSEGSPHCIP